MLRLTELRLPIDHSPEAPPAAIARKLGVSQVRFKPVQEPVPVDVSSPSLVRDPNKCVLFHCGNWAKAFIPDAAIKTAPILGTTLGEENTYGAMAGRTLNGDPLGRRKLSDAS